MHVINQPHRSSEVGRHTSINHLTLDYLNNSPIIKGHRRSASADSRRSEFLALPEMNENKEADEEEKSLLEKPDPTKEFVDTSHLADGHNCTQEECQRVTINVSGMKFETQLRTLNRLPNTLLGDKSKREQFWDEKRNEFFFDRHRPSFQAILYFYQSGGRLRRPLEVPTDVFLSELQFFELGVMAIAAFKESEGFITDNKEPAPMPKRHLQRKIWELFEYPESSLASRIIAVMSVIFITVSVVTFCVETLPQFKESGCINVNITQGNITQETTVPNFVHPLFVIESICITWFVIELICRLGSCPSKIAFFKNFVNWIDMTSIAPFIVSMSMYLITKECEASSKTGAIAVLRVLRVARILKLSKHSEGLQLLGKTMKTSVKELMMFVLFLGIGIVIFSGAIFYAELEQEGTQFHSIPGSFWWAVVTMTTVGYGDMYPVGLFGKLIGTLAVICGLLAIAFPVPVIVTNFSNYYRASTGRGSWG